MSYLPRTTSGRQGLMDDVGYDFYEIEPNECDLNDCKDCGENKDCKIKKMLEESNEQMF